MKLTSDVNADLLASIVSTMHADFDAQKARKDARAQLISLAVQCGLPQAEAIRTNLIDFFDGFLTAHGQVPSRRISE